MDWRFQCVYRLYGPKVYIDKMMKELVDTLTFPDVIPDSWSLLVKSFTEQGLGRALDPRSLVYPDPYKKGLGNKAEVLCILECVNCLRVGIQILTPVCSR